MCLILFGYHVHPKYKLIVAANRDEFYGRETAPAYYWDDHPEILAGRDFKKMGTWMGVTKGGLFAAITNFRNPNENTEDKRSRGELVSNFLKSNVPPEEYLQTLKDTSSMYPGYNLLVGSQNELIYFSNVTKTPFKIEKGVHGVSNHLLNTNWPKVQKGKEDFEKIINGREENIIERLFTLLQISDPAQDEALPNTGVSLEMERMLSPIFIKSENYGTRSSTVLLMNEQKIIFNERVYYKSDYHDQQYVINF
ncbi:NRDE family protein [Schinkia sp. CFF1]